jgi:hypothetical protein
VRRTKKSSRLILKRLTSQRGLALIEEHLPLPFETKVLGVAVTVERIDLTEAGEIVTKCRRGHERQWIPILPSVVGAVAVLLMSHEENALNERPRR